jgi:DNA-binding beta-propeller fold protein YncE
MHYTCWPYGLPQFRITSAVPTIRAQAAQAGSARSWNGTSWNGTRWVCLSGASAALSLLFIWLGGRLACAATAQAAPGGNQATLSAILAQPPGGAIAPCRSLEDPYPEFNGIAVDPENNLVVMSDDNLKSLLVYARTAGSADSPEVTPARAQIKGPATYLSFAAGVALDPVRHQIYATENDVGDNISAFPYTADGDFKSRALAVPHGAYGLGISQKRKQIAATVEHNAEIVFYRLGASGAEAPLREIRGAQTELADPHGLAWDDKNDEIVVVNEGNWSRGHWDLDYNGGGRYQPPSITVYAADAKGDAKPLRVIQGSKTRFNWPAGVAVDNVHDELAVANDADNSILIFRRTDQGNVAPIRVIKGPHSQLVRPMGVALDAVNDELWAANFGHEALVFDRAADGDAAPKRIIRNAPAGMAVTGFGNPGAIAFDSRRQELLVPN